MQIVLAQHPLHVVIALAAAGLHAYPFRLAQAFLQRHDLDWIARCFGVAGLFLDVAHKYLWVLSGDYFQRYILILQVYECA